MLGYHFYAAAVAIRFWLFARFHIPVKADLHAFVPSSVIIIETDFANESFVRHTLDGFNATILKVDYGKNVVLTVELAQKSVQALSEKIGFYGTVKASE